MKLRTGENLLYELRPERRVLIVWLFTRVLPWTLLGGFFSVWLIGMLSAVLAIATDGQVVGIFHKIGITWIGSFLMAFIFSIAYVHFLQATHVYYVTSERCVFVGGIVRYRERSVPYHKITDVETSRSIIERVLGISSIRIFTPGTGSAFSWMTWGGQSPELKFEGLLEGGEITERINERVRDAGGAATA